MTPKVKNASETHKRLPYSSTKRSNNDLEEAEEAKVGEEIIKVTSDKSDGKSKNGKSTLRKS